MKKYINQLFDFNQENMVLHLIDSAGLYGAEKVVLTILEELKNSKYPGILGCIREKESDVPQIARDARKLGIPVKYFTMKRGLNLFGIIRILKYIKIFNIRIVHSHGYKSNIFLAIIPKRKFRTISTAHGWAKNTAGIKTRIYEILDLWALKRIDLVIAVSRAVMEELNKRGLSNKKISLIYNGIRIKQDSIITNVQQLRKTYGLSIDDFVLGSIGRLTKVKGHTYLIEAMPSILKEIKNCKLLIAGEGPLKENLTVLIKNNGLTKYVKLIGYTDKVDEILTMIDVFVLPSLSEGLPISLLEAMAHRKPVLASAVGGIPEVISNETQGILMPPADSLFITKAIVNLYNNKQELNNLSESGRKVVTTMFSSKNMAKKYIVNYSKLISTS